MNETLWCDGSLSLVVSTSELPPPDVAAFIAVQQFGEGGGVYRRQTLNADHYRGPHWFALRQDNTVIGSYLLDARELRWQHQPLAGVYRGLLALAPTARGQGLAGRLTQSALDWYAASRGPCYSYGCVDRNNGKALAVLRRQGHGIIGGLGTVLYYRQRRARATAGIVADAAPDVETALAALPAASLHEPVSPTDWTMIKRGNDWLACRHHGVQLQLAAPGPVGWIGRRLMRQTAYTRRRFDPDAFRYAALSQTVGSPGGAALFAALLEQLLYEHDTHYAMLTLDDGRADPMQQAIRSSAPRRALLNRQQTVVVGRWHGPTAQGPGIVQPDALGLNAPDL
ncbi:MAG: GNAT family N-acetyltransferase [Pseudomonadota bacterium]